MVNEIGVREFDVIGGGGEKEKMWLVVVGGVNIDMKELWMF
ncbi:hypothetical protein [Siminovitchia fortis]|nr:hypothetical protein [Siminovitchia fortis]